MRDREKMDLPSIRVEWHRGNPIENIFAKPRTFLGLGLAESRKSTLLECLGLRFIQKGKVYDFFGPGDTEGRAWYRVLGKDQVARAEF